MLNGIIDFFSFFTRNTPLPGQYWNLDGVGLVKIVGWSKEGKSITYLHEDKKYCVTSSLFVNNANLVKKDLNISNQLLGFTPVQEIRLSKVLFEAFRELNKE